jgi:hypothetical protein
VCVCVCVSRVRSCSREVQGLKHIPHKSSGVMVVGQVVSIPCVKKCTCPEASIVWAGGIRKG